MRFKPISLLIIINIIVVVQTKLAFLYDVTDLHEPDQYKLANNVALLISSYQIKWIFSLSNDVSLLPGDLVSFSLILIILTGILSTTKRAVDGNSTKTSS